MPEQEMEGTAGPQVAPADEVRDLRRKVGVLLDRIMELRKEAMDHVCSSCGYTLREAVE